jgi:HSP20 family protein
MNVIRWEPFREMEDMFRQLPPVLLSGLVRGSGAGRSEPSAWRPVADITENDKEYVVKAELPGVKKEDLKIELQDGILTITGERKVEEEQKDDNQIRVERFYGTFTRSFALPDNVDAKNIRAQSKDGVLMVHIPKKAPAKPEAITVDVK